MRCVVDTSVLIDLGNGGLLHHSFELGLTLSAPTPVLDELVDPDRELLLEIGLGHNVLTLEQLLEASKMSVNENHLSLADCSAFIAARDNEWTLLTGDKRLRQKAEEESLVIHGVLWLIDLMESEGKLDGQALTTSLRKILDAGARLPAEECEKRFRRWKAK